MPGSRQDLRQQLLATAFAQAGYFSAAQAREVGYSYQAQKYHVDHGNWLRVDRALFRLVGWPGGSDDSFARWSVWSAGRAVVSHESALAAHDLSDANPARVHLTVPRTFRKADRAVVLHKGELAGTDIESRSGWRVTSPVRTLVDVAGSDAPQETVDAAVVDAIARGVTTPRRLLTRAGGATRAAARLSEALTTAAEA